MSSSKAKVIAIDGPSGSGKSTIAKLLAKSLGLTYLDTGALYRAIAYELNHKKIDSSEVDRVANYLADMKLSYAPSDEVLVAIDGEDLSHKIREHEVSRLASIYSKIPVVREYLKSFQRDYARVKPSVLEGRDIGTIIFPDAAIKFFLTADASVRAKRRFDQLKELGHDVSSMSVEAIEKDIATRDKADESRSLAPLVKADDAFEINTGNRSLDEIMSEIKSVYQDHKALFS